MVKPTMRLSVATHYQSIWLRSVSSLLTMLLVSGAAVAQQLPLTIETIYDPEHRVNFSGQIPRGLTWLDSDRYL